VANQAAFYLNQLNVYGLPLQTAAANISKVAWQFYLASWLSAYPVAQQLLSRSVAYLSGTPSLVPYGDRYDTTTGIETPGVQAHPTLGAVFALLAAGTQVSMATSTAAAKPASPLKPRIRRRRRRRPRHHRRRLRHHRKRHRLHRRRPKRRRR
jgi:hypothetical protein